MGVGQRALDLARDLQWLWFVVAYFLGFTAVGLYGLHNGWGFVLVDPTHYLAVGFFAASMVVGVLASYAMVWAILEDKMAPTTKQSWATWAKLAAVEFLATLAAGAFGIWFVLALANMLEVTTMELVQVLFTAVTVSALAALIEVCVTLLVFRPSYQQTEATPVSIEELEHPRTRRPLIQIWRTPSRLTFSAFVWTLLVALTFGYILLPYMAPEYGGAAPRYAYFDVEPSALSNESRAALGLSFVTVTLDFNETVWGTVSQALETHHTLQVPSRTALLKVLFVTADYYVIETTDEPVGNRVLLLQKEIVRVVAWSPPPR